MREKFKRLLDFPLKHGAKAYQTLRGAIEGQMLRPSTGTMENCVEDWMRVLNGDWGKNKKDCGYLIVDPKDNKVKPIWQIIKYHLENDWSDLKLTHPFDGEQNKKDQAELLRRFWRTYFIPAGLTKFEESKMLKYFENHLHQGGELYQVRTAMFAILQHDYKTPIPARGTRAFRSTPQGLVCEIETRVSEYRDTQNPEETIMLSLPFRTKERLRIGLDRENGHCRTTLESMEVLSLPVELKAAMELPTPLLEAKKKEWLAYSLKENNVVILGELLAQDPSLIDSILEEGGEKFTVLHLAFKYGAIGCIKTIKDKDSGAFERLLKYTDGMKKSPIQLGIENNIGVVLQQFSLRELRAFAAETPPLLTQEDFQKVARHLAENPRQYAADLAKCGQYSNEQAIHDEILNFIIQHQSILQPHEIWKYIEEMQQSDFMHSESFKDFVKNQNENFIENCEVFIKPLVSANDTEKKEGYEKIKLLFANKAIPIEQKLRLFEMMRKHLPLKISINLFFENIAFKDYKEKEKFKSILRDHSYLNGKTPIVQEELLSAETRKKYLAFLLGETEIESLLRSMDREGFSQLMHRHNEQFTISALVKAIPGVVSDTSIQSDFTAQRLILLLKDSIIKTKWSTSLGDTKLTVGRKTYSVPKHVAKMYEALGTGFDEGKYKEALRKVSDIASEAAASKVLFRSKETHDFYRSVISSTESLRAEMRKIRPATDKPKIDESYEPPRPT